MGRIPVVGLAALVSLATLAIAQQAPVSATSSTGPAPSTAPSAPTAPTAPAAPAAPSAPSPQTTQPPAASTLSTATRSGTAAATWTVEVGKGDHRFTPDVVQANPGDTIDFRFFPTNHSVIRAEYQYPCIPYEMTGRGKVGAWSGFRAVDAILDDPPSWKLLINDTSPIFFYCSAPGSCIDYQMVGVINPNSSVSLQKQKDLAKQAKYQLSPGENFPDEAASKSMSSVYATGGVGAAEATSKPDNDDDRPSGSHHLSAGAIAGIAIGAAAVLVLAAALFFYMGRTKKLQDHVNRTSTLPMGSEQGGPNQDYRHSQMTSNAYPAPPYDQKDGYLDPAMSPRSNAMSPSPRAPFEEFGGVHQSPIDRPQSVEVDGTGHPPPKQTGPVEMYAPLK